MLIVQAVHYISKLETVNIYNVRVVHINTH